MEVRRVGSGAKWEPLAGYVRAVRAGNQIAVAGTLGLGEDGVPPEEAYGQARLAIAIIARALKELGAGLRDVVRTRMFVTDIGLLEEIGRAHREAFGDHPPAATMVEVRRLAHPQAVIEIEADAWVPDGWLLRMAGRARVRFGRE